MLVVLGWITLSFIHLGTVNSRYLDEGRSVAVESLELLEKSEEFIDDAIVGAKSFEATEDTGDEPFLIFRPKVFDLAPSESDYENEVKNADEDF
ncbi:hypothetical protein GCK72_023758 [Caenorhabditis remanei]|uniref:Uncharacterized protein n=1 Tax=Caenorhabditis remanei TaxID=31234 RepID=A0A6A5FXG5_CAERE|nr:hypothetical protein GCK72_023758 [Caenorhabditis remanei]KAF1747296.1 hypothetical protein GCK72_023758 [Caenorhabditis remanei]